MKSSALSRREVQVALLLLALVVGVGFFNRGFWTLGNARDVGLNVAPVAIIACGLTFVIVLGEIDISMGSLFGLLAAVLGVVASPDRMGLGTAPAIVAVLTLGALAGALNGILVVWARIPSIIVTLGALTFWQGATEIAMGGNWIKSLPDSLRWWGTGALLGVPIALWAMIVAVLGCSLLAGATPLGRRLYASGSNAHAAELAGLKVGALKMFAFTLTGFLTGVAVIVSVPRLSVIESGAGRGLELAVVTAAVVGGASLRGGRGTVGGSLLAALLLGSVGTALIFLRLGETATYWGRAIQGAFILLAVLVDHAGRGARARD